MERTLPRTLALKGWVGALLLAVCAAGCRKPPTAADTGGGGASDPPSPAAPGFEVAVQVLDEVGSPLVDATYSVELGGSGATSDGRGAAETTSGRVDSSGRFRLSRLVGPVVAVLDAPGYLSEPLVLGQAEALEETHVRLHSATGPGGRRRIVFHFGGDTMLGRRYIEPTSEVSARVIPGDGGTSARAVVKAVAPLFRAASLRSVNLETVVGQLPRSEAYPKKRFLLQSPPETIALLDELGVNVTTLGNNHSRDWLEPGLASTVSALDVAQVPHAGGGSTSDAAAEPLEIDLGSYRVGVLSYTSVNGDFVNDNLPLNSARRPIPLAASEAWQYEFRSFGYSGPTIDLAVLPRRIGEFWQSFKTLEEAGASEAELDDLWSSAVNVYPELQDWVARRGHGGANPYEPARLSTDVALLRSRGCDLVIVQFHGGFQFFEVKSENIQSAAHRAIDAGADIVVCHHPHVLQGFEWYRGKLVAHSLGNFVFDQDFLSTFPTAILRVIFEETDIIEARVYPLVIERYRPSALAGRSAAQVLQILHERSVLPFSSERFSDGVRNILQSQPAGVVVPGLRLENNSAVIETTPATSRAVTVTSGASSIASLDPPSLTRSRGPGGAGLTGLQLGRDLFRWGDFEDSMADGEGRGGAHWLLNDTIKRAEVLAGAPSGERCLRLRRKSSNTQRVVVRPVARVPMSTHHLYEDVGGVATPRDGQPTFSLRLQARISGGGRSFVRFDVYHFDDSNPTEDPESTLLRSREETLHIAADGSWHEINLDLSGEVLRPAGALEANAILFNLGLEPPDSGASVLLIDDVQILEWRPAESLPDGFYALDAVRTANPGDSVVLERTNE